MVRTRSMAAVPRSRNLVKTKAARPKRKRMAAAAISSEELERMTAAAISPEELKRMAAAASAVDVAKILRLKKEAMEAMETECFPLTARAKQAAAAARARLAAAGHALLSGAEEEKAPEEEEKKKKTKVVTYLVPQSYIDHMKAGLFHGVDEIPEDELAKESALFRESYRAKALLGEKLRACQQVLLDQYDAFGYAYDAKEVTDDEGEVALKN